MVKNGIKNGGGIHWSFKNDFYFNLIQKLK